MNSPVFVPNWIKVVCVLVPFLALLLSVFIGASTTGIVACLCWRTHPLLMRVAEPPSPVKRLS